MKFIHTFFLTLLSFSLFSQGLTFENAEWRFQKEGSSAWLPAGKTVDLFAALQKIKPLADPAFGGGDSLNKAIETANWIFEKEFWIKNADEAGSLKIEAVDTYADVYFNDKLVQRCNNAFIGYEISLEELAKKGSNKLRIHFRSPITADLGRANSASVLYPADSDNHPKKTSVFTRKPAYHFGWDFAQRRVNFGASGIKLNPAKKFAIDYLRLENNKGKKQLRASIYSLQKNKVEYSWKSEKRSFIHTAILPKGNSSVYLNADPEQIPAWWPNGMGAQNLYKISLEIKDGNKTEISSEMVGFSNVQVNRSTDQIGEKFQFTVNGKPFFAKGFNYIQTEKSVTEKEVIEWRNSGVNMIRVWGGGNYGDGELYRLCDKHGILIWQDFMFANTMYPGDPEFIQNVKNEVAYQIKRLRHHPSLALWCGNNEIEVAWTNWGWQQKYKYSEEDSIALINDYNKLFKEIIPHLIDSLDGQHPYISSSPISNWGTAEDFTVGDNHYWGVYHGEQPIEAYKDHIPRFASEYGMQSYPDIETLKEFIAEKDLTLNNPKIQALQLSYKGNKLLEKYQDQVAGKATDLEDFIYKSQIVQAEAMKTAIEAHRRNMDKCAGSLVWQWNDPAVAASWSMVDARGRKKEAYTPVMNSFHSWMVSPIVNENRLEVWLANDYDQQNEVKISLTLNDFFCRIIKAKTLSEQGFTNEGKLVFSDELSNWLNEEDRTHFYLETTVSSMKNGAILHQNVSYFAPLKDLKLPDPEIHYTLEKTGIKLSWKKHAAYLQFHIAGEVYYPEIGATSILLPFDQVLIYNVKARSLGNENLKIRP